MVENIFGGDPIVYWGFTASTSTLFNQQAVHQVNLALTDVSNKIISPLPVTLVNFTAAKTDAGTKLTWSTASEKNSAYFQVERSADAKNWTALTSVAAHGNSNIVNTYNFTDATTTTSLAYYRLKMVDIDGTSEFSKVISVQAANRVTTSVNVFPNPAQNTESLKIAFKANENAAATLTLLDMMGNVVKSENQSAVAGNNVYSLALNSVKPGIYLVQVSCGTTKETIRVVVR